MSDKVFINLPVSDLQKSIGFFTNLGYTFNLQFTDDTATCMIISEHIYAMLLTHEKFKGFAPNPIANARETTEAIIALTCESRAAMDEMVAKAVAAGGNTYNQPQDHGFMYAHGFQDPDGHIWEYFWMDPSFVQPQG